MIRIDRAMVPAALSEGVSGVLTASGTIAAAESMGVPVVVTAGMGGIGYIEGEELCPDLPALAETDVALIATSPKDVLDIPATIDWLLSNGVKVLGRESAVCCGFVFRCGDVPISRHWRREEKITPHTLLLREIEKDKRLRDISILSEAKLAGKLARQRGESYHVAANAEIDRLSNGLSSRLQLQSLIDNGLWAEKLTKGDDGNMA
jgi:hypothetical protein